MDQPFVLPHDFSNEVRLFPLPNLVMFPASMQPLHIFESRYREMFEDALDNDRLIAMATLQPGFSESQYFSRPPLSPTVCIGKIAQHEKTADGTYNLVLVGVARAEIVEELDPVLSYRRARVRVIEWDENANPQEEAASGKRLNARLQQMTSATQKLGQKYADGSITLSVLTDVLAFHFPLPQDKKLQLLNEPNPSVRAETLLKIIPEDAVVEAEEDAQTDDDSYDGAPPFSMN